MNRPDTAPDMDLTIPAIYHPDMPDFLPRLLQTQALQRIAHVGMNCGCEYTQMHPWAGIGAYSRLQHSIGVALIVWHFTHDVQQAVAGLLHDIATPVFAHVIDFMNGDHLTQESTETDTRRVIDADAGLQAQLARLGLTTDDVADYHRFPIADNPTPRLSADRLEYTLGNIVNYGFAGHREVSRIYDDLTVMHNEQGQPELGFAHTEPARAFGSLMLRCSQVYVSDQDRYAMQHLALLIAGAVRQGVIGRADLMTTEPQIISRLSENHNTAEAWRAFCALRKTSRSAHPQQQGLWLKIPAKKRHIDPLVRCSEGLPKRLSSLEPQFASDLHRFLQSDFDYWVGDAETTNSTEHHENKSDKYI